MTKLSNLTSTVTPDPTANGRAVRTLVQFAVFSLAAVLLGVDTSDSLPGSEAVADSFAVLLSSIAGYLLSLAMTIAKPFFGGAVVAVVEEPEADV